jgi:hypothetical protein
MHPFNVDGDVAVGRQHFFDFFGLCVCVWVCVGVRMIEEEKGF